MQGGFSGWTNSKLQTKASSSVRPSHLLVVSSAMAGLLTRLHCLREHLHVCLQPSQCVSH